MRVLLDTHVLIALTQRRLSTTYPTIHAALEHGDVGAVVSVASLWEIAIKARLGKLVPGTAVGDLAAFFRKSGMTILPIEEAHVVAELVPPPRTRDPFDRLLLAQCQVEGLRLVSVDAAMADHPLVLTTL